MSEIPIPELPEPPPAGKPSLLYRLQPLLTLVIAMAAIGLAIWEGHENRRHNRMSVQPRLSAAIDVGQDNAGEYVRMSIENTGLGPAAINTFRVYWDGALQDTVGRSQWQKVLDALAESGTELNARGLGTGEYIPAGRHHVLFDAKRRTGAGSLGNIPNRIAVQICYCSIYDTDCDQVLLTTAQLTPVKCAVPASSRSR